VDRSHPKAEEKASVPGEIKLWSAAQEQAFNLLLEIAAVFYETNWSATGLRPRLDPLIVGSTGMGKSYLVGAIAQKLDLPILRLSYNEWIVMGAKEPPQTLMRVRTFVNDHPRGLIHIDELDKFKAVHRTDWSTSVYGELFLLLDRALQQPSRGREWTAELQARLRMSFLIVGSGTWQSTWEQATKAKLGFGSRSLAAPESIQTAIENSGVIPSELFRRFNSELVILSSATEDDYRRGSELFGLDKMARELGTKLDFADATERKLGARWLEESFGRLLRLARKQGKNILPPVPPPAPDPTSDEPLPDFGDLSDSDSDSPF
jgi:SpoVK/Ycf46/Vps4 family AAA+-type ATPase